MLPKLVRKHEMSTLDSCIFNLSDIVNAKQSDF